MKSKILLVDDEEKALQELGWSLETDYHVLMALNESEAMATFQREKPQVVILDLSHSQTPAAPGGLRLLDQFLEQEPSTRIIVVTAHNDDANALQAVRLGAFDYYSRPIVWDEIKVIVKRAFRSHQLHQRIQPIHSVSGPGLHCLIGISRGMQEIYRFIDRTALSDISVLIFGESGTGKELVAHAIHQRSLRRDNPFIVVNCGAIPEALLESELFGHEEGAFTGAFTQKKGKLELANTGTLFLNEIGELPPHLQEKLLRFLQDRKIERVGGTQQIDLDVRIVAATNRDPKKDMENHLFREDLYHRLKIIPLTIPPLRERTEDILPLAQHFLKKYCREQRKPLISLAPEAEAKLLSYPWPGNVRQLENLINRAILLTPDSVLYPSVLGFGLDQAANDVNLKHAKKVMEIEYVQRALLRNKGIVSRAARDLGISRVNLYELMGKHAINSVEFKTPNLKPQRQPVRSTGSISKT
ncbi:MAG: sigma-54-dependent transcriptional regulator [Candidatus Binatia bacterium]